MSLKLFGGAHFSACAAEAELCRERNRVRDVHNVQTGQTHMAMQLLISQSAAVTPAGQKSHCVLFTHSDFHLSKQFLSEDRPAVNCSGT